MPDCFFVGSTCWESCAVYLPYAFEVWLTGMCAILSCAIQLAASLLSSGLLIVLRNFHDGVLSSNRTALFPLSELLQVLFHSAFTLS